MKGAQNMDTTTITEQEARAILTQLDSSTFIRNKLTSIARPTGPEILEMITLQNGWWSIVGWILAGDVVPGETCRYLCLFKRSTDGAELWHPVSILGLTKIATAFRTKQTA